MPLFVGASSKAMPQAGIEYITDENKAEITSVQNLDPGRDLAGQFTATAKLHGHYKDGRERKYYHFKLSPDPTDNVGAAECHKLGEQLAAEVFKNHECVISTHTDTPIAHTHIIINAVNFETGKKLDIRNHAYGKMKDRANTLGADHGMTAIDFRKRAERVKAPEAMQDLREVIDEAKVITTNMTDFKAHLRKYGVVVRETGNTISYLHPKRKKPIRGDKLGAEYTKGAIIDVIEKQGNRGAAAPGRAVGGTRGGKGEGVREHAAEEIAGGEHTTGGGRVLAAEEKVRGIADGVRKLTPAGKKEQERLAERAKRKQEQLAEKPEREPEQTVKREPAAPVQHRSKSTGHER